MLIGLQLEELYWALYDFRTDLVLGDSQLVTSWEGRWETELGWVVVVGVGG